MSGQGKPDQLYGVDDETMISGVALPTPSQAPPPPDMQSVNKSMLGPQSRAGLPSFVAAAALLHVLVFGAAMLLPRFFAGPQAVRKPIIAHVLAQGKARDPRLMPRKVEAPTAGTSKTAPPSTVVASARPAPAGSSSSKAAPAAPAKRAPSRAELMARALASVSGDAPREARAPDPERAGAEGGSATGTAETAEIGDLYYTAVHDAIQEHYVVPSVISERERLFLRATMVLWIGKDGTLLKHRLEASSGNRFFDSALEGAIAQTHLPAPPPELLKALATDGVGINFTP